MRKKELFEFSNKVNIIGIDEDFLITSNSLSKNGGNRAFVLTDKNLIKFGYLERLKNNLTSHGKIQIEAIYDDIESTPTKTSINKVYEKYRKSGCDCIIALGGGSVMVVAKALILLVSTNTKNIIEFEGINCAKREKAVSSCLIPTTFGSGAEVSKLIVILDDVHNTPMTIVSDLLQPNFCVLNSEFISSLPDKEIYLNLIDVLAFNIESYISLKSNIMVKNYVKTSLFILGRNIQSVTKERDNTALSLIQRASTLAGIAYSNAFAGVMHALSHTLTAKYGIHHTLALCSIMEACLKFNINVCEKEYDEMFLCLVGAKSYAALESNERGQAFINIFKNLISFMNDKFNIDTKLSKLGIKEEDFDSIIKLTLQDGSLITNPKSVNYEDIKNILLESM